MNDYRIVVTNRDGNRENFTCRPTRAAAAIWLHAKSVSPLSDPLNHCVMFYNDLGKLVGIKDFDESAIDWRGY